MRLDFDGPRLEPDEGVSECAREHARTLRRKSARESAIMRLIRDPSVKKRLIGSNAEDIVVPGRIPLPARPPTPENALVESCPLDAPTAHGDDLQCDVELR